MSAGCIIHIGNIFFNVKFSVRSNARDESSDVKFELSSTNHERRSCTVPQYFLCRSLSLSLALTHTLSLTRFPSRLASLLSKQKETNQTSSDNFFLFSRYQL